jgi:outer membrane lipoprotein-sorting protein
MKRYLSLATLFFFFVGLVAQHDNLPQVKDPAAKEILDKLVEKSKTFKTVKAKFDFTLENEQEDINENYSGDVSFKGDNYRLSLMGVTTYCDGTTIWTHIVEAEEVNVSTRDPKDGSFMNNPQKIFSGYNEDFKYKLVGEKKSDSGTLVQIELYPEQLEQGLLPDDENDIDYSKILLTIDKMKYELISAKYFGQNGSNYLIKILDFNTNTLIDDASFKFNTALHPDVEIIDLRE